MKTPFPFFFAFIVCISFLLPSATSQGLGVRNRPIDKANYDLAARFSSEKINKMVFSTAVSPHWLKGSSRFWYEYATPEGKKWFIVDAATGTKKELFDAVKVAEEVSLVMKDPFDAQHLPIQDLKFIDNEKKIRFSLKSSLDDDKKEEEKSDEPQEKKGKSKKLFWFEYELSTGKLTFLADYDKEKDYPRWANISPDGETILFMKKDQLYWMDKANFEKARKNEKDSSIVEHKITDDGEEDFSYGYVSGNETNVDKKKNKDKRHPVSVYWSPDSKHFALIRDDSREVGDLWVVNSIAEPRPTLESYKYQMPGEEKSPQYSLYLFSNGDKSSRLIDVWAFKDQSLFIHRKPSEKSSRDDDYRAVIWQGFADKFYINRTSRDLKRVDVCEVDVNSGLCKTLIEERLNTYVDGRPLWIVPGSGDLIHWSERSGWGHYYLYDAQGRLKNAITSGPYHCEYLEGLDAKTGQVYLWANGREKGENPYYAHLYKVSLQGGSPKLLKGGDFHHEGSMDDQARYFVDNYSRVNTAPQSDLLTTDGRLICALETADLSRLFEAGYRFPEPFKVKADDGITDLYGVMYKPFDFDSTRLYPLVEYVYPGPQTEAVNASFSKSMERTDRLAQMGMIVITIGNRGGHPARSKWYHNYGYGNLRDYGLADKKAAAQQLAQRHPYIDINKVGITGHSGGGFMSTAAILVYPEFFKVAVSNAGNHDNSIYNRWWSEKHHGILEQILKDKKDSTGLKQDTTFKYSIPNNQSLAKNLRGKLLLTTGEIDNNVHPANTMRVVNALIVNKKRFDLIVFPTQRHSYGNMTEYFFWRMADYFSEHLIGDSQSKETDIWQMHH